MKEDEITNEFLVFTVMNDMEDSKQLTSKQKMSKWTNPKFDIPSPSMIKSKQSKSLIDTKFELILLSLSMQMLYILDDNQYYPSR